MNNTNTIFERLQQRSFVQDHTDKEKLNSLLQTPQCVYAGFDPSASSLHLGNLLPIIALKHFQLAGHTPIIVVGGATGLIGDPSGKSTERQLLNVNQVESNLRTIKKCFHRFLSFEGNNAAVILNNYDWLSEYSHLDWLRDVGKFFTVNSMLAKDSVRTRIEFGVSYTEFSYSLLQAYDFLYLNRHYNCSIQLGGSDQWGNITAGAQLIRKLEGSQNSVHGMTIPILETAEGTKFGKSEGNALWLDKEKTSPYKMYQYLLNTSDKDTDNLLKMLTFIPLEQINELDEKQKESPQFRASQKALANALVEFIHGKKELTQAINMSQVFFSEDYGSLTENEIEEIFNDEYKYFLNNVDFENKSLSSLLMISGVVSSISKARKLLQQGGVSFNGKYLPEEEKYISRNELLHRKYLIIKRGKKTYYLIKVL